MFEGGPVATRTLHVALVGNPNAGKTSVFNALTGARQKVGNYPGVTVERCWGEVELDGRRIRLVDVPGLYSMNPESEDEAVAVQAIRGEVRGEPEPDVIVFVMDGSNLERNLYLFSEVVQLGKPMVVALTMTDLVRKEGHRIRIGRLSEELGVPVVPVVAHKKIGVRRLLQRVQQAPAVGYPLPKESWPSIAARYDWAHRVAAEVLGAAHRGLRRRTTDRLDRWLTHRAVGLLVFFVIFYLVFQSIYTLSQPLMDAIGAGFDWLGAWLGDLFAPVPALRSLLVDGVLAGVGTVLTFLPQILILFFFIGVLEGSGYLARAAFMMDRLLSWCGLNGRAFIPLLSSFACAVPGILATRVMPDRKSRLATMLIAPLMSCSARLPTYMLVIGAVVEPRFGPLWAGAALFGMHLVGLAFAVPIGWLLNRKVLRGRSLPFMMELPPYQMPKWRDVGLAMYLKARTFVQTAGTIIVAMSVVVWALLYFPRSEETVRRLEAEHAALGAQGVSREAFLESGLVQQSYLGRMGSGLERVFGLAGFDWRLSTALLASFPAREVAVSTLGVIFNLGGEVDGESKDLRRALAEARRPDGAPLLTPAVAASFMVFMALCCQCMATLATVRKETGSWRWPVFLFAYMTLLAYGASVAVYQVASRLIG
ncbi:MAG: ferrous iron transporter B [Fimbriimonadales bacterium]|nr:ferrous iron transporter B [Fimbriimonadales bacterium]